MSVTRQDGINVATAYGTLLSNQDNQSTYAYGATRDGVTIASATYTGPIGGGVPVSEYAQFWPAVLAYTIAHEPNLNVRWVEVSGPVQVSGQSSFRGVRDVYSDSPPPYGQPPYNAPGTPGTPEYADYVGVGCPTPAVEYVYLKRDGAGSFYVQDCEIAYGTLVFSPCDQTYGPPSPNASVSTYPGQTHEEYLAEVIRTRDMLVEAHVPNARELLTLAGCTDPARDRIRSSVDETIGDVIRGASAIDVSASEAFVGVTLPLQQPVSFYEALRPFELAYTFYPSRQLDDELVDSYQYDTLMRRLSTHTPRAFMVLARQYPSRLVYEDSEDDGAAKSYYLTATRWVAELFSHWRNQYRWFEYNAVPPLLLRLPGDERGYRTLRASALAVPQVKGSERTMRDIMDEILEVFQGYTLRQTPSGTFYIQVPPWHPDAEAALELSVHDLVSLPPEPPLDGTGVYTRAVVRDQGYEFVGDEDEDDLPEVLPPAYMLRSAFAESALEPDTVMGGGIGETSGDEQVRQNRVRVRPGETWRGETLIGGSTVELQVQFDIYSAGPQGQNVFYEEGSRSFEVVLELGVERLVTNSSRVGEVAGIGGFTTRAAFGFTWTGAGILVRADSVRREEGGYYFAYHLKLNAFGQAWMRSRSEITAVFEQADRLPGLRDAQAQYGVVTAPELTSSIFALGRDVTERTETAEALAQNIVAANMDPVRRYRGLRQTAYNAYPVRPATIGKRVMLPNGLTGVVERRSYGDAFGYNSAMIESSMDVIVTESWVPDGVTYLTLDTLEYLRLDDGSFAEVS